MYILLFLFFFFFFNDTATTEIYTLSLHDALPISEVTHFGPKGKIANGLIANVAKEGGDAQLASKAIQNYLHNPSVDRKSTRLNSSHSQISYAVFCLKKKKKKHNI